MEGRVITSGITSTSSKRVILSLIGVLLALLASGCAGGSRSGSDQPGVAGPPNAAAQEVSINEASEDDIAAALRRSDVGDPQGWARIVTGYRPYPPGQAGEEQLRQILVQYNADPEEIDKITRAVAP
jgi:hypothetical protein